MTDERKPNIWIGLGISKRYVDLSENLKSHLQGIQYNQLLIILAIEMSKRYNGQINEAVLKQIQTNLARFTERENINPKNKVEVFTVAPFYENPDYQRAFTSTFGAYADNTRFREEVNKLVRRNRGSMQNLISAGYVLEELSLIRLFRQKAIKIGQRDSELAFDTLAIKYLGSHPEDFRYI